MMIEPNRTPGRDPLVIGLVGAAGAGKDSVASHLVDHYGFLQIALAEPINDMLATMLEHMSVDHAVLHERHLKERAFSSRWPGVTPRQLKQRLGDWGRQIDPAWWVDMMAHRLGVNDLGEGHWIHDRIVVSDVRFPNEAMWVHGVARGVLVDVERPGLQPVLAHLSEAARFTTAIQDRIGYRLVNDSTLDVLRTRVSALCHQLDIDEREPVQG